MGPQPWTRSLLAVDPPQHAEGLSEEDFRSSRWDEGKEQKRLAGNFSMSKFPKKKMTPLTEEELNAVTIVFHQYETGLREGTIYTRDLLPAMKALGLSPTEQEVVDMQCEVERRGRIFFPC